METKNQTAQESAQSGVVDYAAALRQYHRYVQGRSMKKFGEDEGTTTGSSANWREKVRARWMRRISRTSIPFS